MTPSKPAKEFYFKEGCYIQEWHNSAQDPDMSIARVRVEPNAETRLHALTNTSERYIILSGEAETSVNHQSREVKQGDVVVIPAGAPQKIRNRLDTDLVFLAVCQPRFQEHNYQDLEDFAHDLKGA